MKRWRPVSRIAWCALMAGTILAAEPRPASPDRPNVLLILTDDQRADTIGALGNRIIRTPELDRLVRGGTVLSSMIVPYPVCTPSRTELLTGLTFMRAMAAGAKPPTLPETLRAGGYHTWYVGKWHVAGRPRSRGFEGSKGLYTTSAKMPPPPVTNDPRGNPITGYRGAVFMNDEGDEYPELGVGLTPNISERFADAAIELIGTKPSRPFFLQVSFTAPHDPRLVPAGFEKMYPPQSMPLPSNYADAPAFDTGNLGTRDERLLPKPLAAAAVREELAAYYALLSHVDAQVGRMIAALRETGQLERTIVIFTSDHGLALGSHGLLGKQNMYDHTLRVPFVIHGPRIPAGERRAGQAYLRDLVATILDYCGVTAPAGLDSVSLRDLIDGRVAQVHPFLVGYYLDQSRMIRTPQWKLCVYPKSGTRQLFEIARDPDELRDRSGDPALAEKIGELENQLTRWLAGHGEPKVGRAGGG